MSIIEQNLRTSTAKLMTVVDDETGEIVHFKKNDRTLEYVQDIPKEDAVNNARHYRFRMQRSAVGILSTTKNPKSKPWRVLNCLSAVNGSEVGVIQSLEHHKASFTGLQTCGSAWVCPCCSAKISERRKQEIIAATDLHKSAGGGLYLVTLTWSHHRHDDLAQMVKASRASLVKLRALRAYKDNLKSINYLGMIRAFEVTHGDENGWHPHFHELFFVAKPLTRQQLRDWEASLYAQWRAQCLAFGLGEPNRKRGITIISAESAGEYIAKFGNAPKWGVASELVKSQTKHGRKGSRTPWDMLRLYDEGEQRYAHLFRDYAKAFFGARQVFWTPLLKAAFGLDELTDEEIAAREEDNAVFICRISKEDWKLVINKYDDYRSVVLSLAESGGEDSIRSFLDSI